MRNLIDEAEREIKRTAGRAGIKNTRESIFLSACEWCLDEARAEAEAGSPDDRVNSMEDIFSGCASADEIIMNEKAFALNPGEEHSCNPYYRSLNGYLKDLLAGRQKTIRDTEGLRRINDAWIFRFLGQDSAILSWGLTHPASAFCGSGEVLKCLLTNLRAILQGHNNGDFNTGRKAVYGPDPNINRFCLAPSLDAFAALTAECRWALPAARIKEWLDSFRRLVDYQVETYGPRYHAHRLKGPLYYPNMDVLYVFIMSMAHKIFRDEKYNIEKENFLGLIEDAIQPMGAWTYSRSQNECFVYHQLSVNYLGRLYTITEDKRIFDILEKTIPYFPLVIEPEGMTEYYTDPSWKHMWTPPSPSGADIIAGLFNDPENKSAANDCAANGRYVNKFYCFCTAPYWKRMKSPARADNYIIYDENIEGPRGRFGNFSFAGTARKTGKGEKGKDTLVGCMISDRERKPVPLDSALQAAAVEVRLSRGNITCKKGREFAENNHWFSGAYCCGSEKSSVLVKPDFSSLCAKYRITRPGENVDFVDEPWEGVQQWFLAPYGLIGLLTIRPLEDVSCPGVWGRLRLGMHRTIKPDYNGEVFRYGGLMIKIHAHNFTSVETAPSETFYLDRPENYRSAEILLKDENPPDGGASKLYRKGGEFFFLAEVSRGGNPASGASIIRSGRVRGFKFSRGNAMFFVLHNESENSEEFEITEGDSCEIFYSNGVGRACSADAGRFTFDIKGNSHVVALARN